MTTAPTWMHAHAESLRQALSEVLAGPSLLRLMLRYHVGLSDAEGHPTTDGGKLLRPRLLLFLAEELGVSSNAAMPAAVALELVHAFSLLHDDIQDRDRTRRGRPAAWTVWGEAQAINAGDLLHSIAMRTALQAGVTVAKLLLKATETMIEGQSQDLQFERRRILPGDYLEMIDKKTGALITAALEIGGALAGVDEQVSGQLRTLGRSLGRAFQIQDDLLGLWGDPDRIGKPAGSDLRRRKNTYPLVLALQEATGGGGTLLEAAFARQEPPSAAEVEEMLQLISDLGVRQATEAAVQQALCEASAACAELPLSPAGHAEMEKLFAYLGRRDR